MARGKIIITLDSDLQHFPEEIPFFLERIDSGVDVVCGWRAERKEGVLRRWPSWVANLLLRKLSGLKIHDIGTTYRAYRAEIAKNIVLFGDSHRFIPILAQELGATIEEIKIKNIGRSVGRSNYGLSRTFDICLDMVFIYFSKHYSNRPLRFFGKLSAICGFLSMISAVLFCWLLSVEGFSLALAKYSWILAAAIVAFAIAIFNLALGVLGEATTRTYHVMQRSDVSRTLNEHSHHRS